MYGYIYLTTNKINGHLYVGQKKGGFNPYYYGSGTALKSALKKYGKENFIVKQLCIANTQEELDDLEIRYIKEYRDIYGNDNLYNIRDGGHPSGVFYMNKSEEDKQKFVDKMTMINRERTSTPEFKEKLSKATTERYKDPEERRKHSEKIREAWSDPELRKKQSEKLKDVYKDGPRDCSFNYQKCVFEFGDIYIEFESVKALWEYLANTYNYHPDRRQQKKLFENGKNRVPFKAFHKKFKHLDGMLIYKL